MNRNFKDLVMFSLVSFMIRLLIWLCLMVMLMLLFELLSIVVIELLVLVRLMLLLMLLEVCLVSLVLGNRWLSWILWMVVCRWVVMVFLCVFRWMVLWMLLSVMLKFSGFRWSRFVFSLRCVFMLFRGSIGELMCCVFYCMLVFIVCSLVRLYGVLGSILVCVVSVVVLVFCLVLVDFFVLVFGGVLMKLVRLLKFSCLDIRLVFRNGCLLLILICVVLLRLLLSVVLVKFL